MIHGNTDTEGTEVQIVCFRLAGREYGFPILQVKEIMRLKQVIELPELSRVFEGAVNLRGQLVPLVDMRKRYGVKPPEDIIPKVLILKVTGEDFMGAMVDDISEIITLPRSKFLSLASSVLEEETRKISGIVELDGGRSIIILDVSSILDDRELERMQEKINTASGGAPADQ